MHKPLVPIDGSASALRALTFALSELQGRADALVHLINVQTPPIHTLPSKLVPPDVINQELLREGHQLMEPAQAAARAAGIACVRHARIGHPAGEITACAAEQGCDAIVMSTRGMGALAGMLLGSVATKVVHLSTVPVTLVK